jgi:hypothetical protein
VDIFSDFCGEEFRSYLPDNPQLVSFLSSTFRIRIGIHHQEDKHARVLSNMLLYRGKSITHLPLAAH